MEMSASALVLIGLLLAAWTGAAAWGLAHAFSLTRGSQAQGRAAKRMARLLDESPALPLIVRGDGKLEGPERLAAWLGLDSAPRYLSELSDGEKGLDPDQLKQLQEAVRRTQKTAAPFRMIVTPQGSERSLAMRGNLADESVAAGGAAVIWWFD